MATRPTVNTVAYGPELEPHQIILRPLLLKRVRTSQLVTTPTPSKCILWQTSCRFAMLSSSCSRYGCSGVRTMNCLGKHKRFKGELGKLPNWKKAIVKLNSEDKIDFI